MSLGQHSNGVPGYSLKTGTATALSALLDVAKQEIPNEFYDHVTDVKFHSTEEEGSVSLPCSFKETEAVSALKAVEAGAVATLTDLRYGPEKRSIMIDFERAATFLFAAYMSTIDGMGKGDPSVKSKLIGISRKDKARFLNYFSKITNQGRYGSVAGTIKPVSAVVC